MEIGAVQFRPEAVPAYAYDRSRVPFASVLSRPWSGFFGQQQTPTDVNDFGIPVGGIGTKPGTEPLDSSKQLRKIWTCRNRVTECSINQISAKIQRLSRRRDSITASGSTTTEYSYDDTEQTVETVYSGTPSALGALQSSQQYQYDLQGRMTGVTITTYTNGSASQIEQLTYGYDDNGNRVFALDQVDANANGTWDTQTLTEYLNDSNNFTGYTQVLCETQSDPTTGQLQAVTEYNIGLTQISQTTTPYLGGLPGTRTTLYFGYDGHGSVRLLTNTAAALATVAGVRQLFNYDAYGNAIGFTIEAAATTLLYSGQQTDAATGLQYLRARYYNPTSGTFISFDPNSGDSPDPLSYNKYLYAQGNPVNDVDPTGRGADTFTYLLAMSLAGGLRSRDSIDGTMMSLSNKPALIERLKAIQKEYEAKWPELYKAMGLDKFFPTLLAAAQNQITVVFIDRSLGQEALYGNIFNILTLSKPIKDVSAYNLIHECVHALDDQEDWYLTSTYMFNVRKSEELAYGAAFILQSFDDLMRLKGRQGKLPDWAHSWNVFWAPFLAGPSGTHDVDVVYQYVRGLDFTVKLNNEALANVKRLLGIEVNYQKIAPLFKVKWTP